MVSLAHTSTMDTTSLQQIVQIFEDSKDAIICLTNMRAPVRSMLHRYASLSEPKNCIANNVRSFVSTHDAVLYCQKQIRGESVSLDSNATNSRENINITSLKKRTVGNKLSINATKNGIIKAVPSISSEATKDSKIERVAAETQMEQKSDSGLSAAIDKLHIELDSGDGCGDQTSSQNDENELPAANQNDDLY